MSNNKILPYLPIKNSHQKTSLYDIANAKHSPFANLKVKGPYHVMMTFAYMDELASNAGTWQHIASDILELCQPHHRIWSELLALKLPDFEIKLNWFVFTKISVDNSGKFKFTVNAMTNLKLLFLPAILTKVSTIEFPEILLPVKSMSMTAILECHDYKLTGLCQESDSKCLQCPKDQTFCKYRGSCLR